MSSVKGSTRGARHLAESAVWLAWQIEAAHAMPSWGMLAECVLAKWKASRLAEFLEWRKGLPV
jgi:hypothetical protein